MPDAVLTVKIGALTLANPLLPASGTYGYGREYLPFISPDIWGAIVTKGVSTEPWEGNAMPRICETPAGMLNAIGLQNPGVEKFISEAIPFLANYHTPVIVNVVGKSIDDYVAVVRRLTEYSVVSAFELNISCPNIKEGGIAFGTDPTMAATVTGAVRTVTDKPLIVKLSPNVSDITCIALAVEKAGADAISLINTILGMAIDIHHRRPVLANIFGGLSGPAVKPVALRMIWQVYRAVSLPIIGMGGITTAEDALAFIMAGASSVAIGTALYINPNTPAQVLSDISTFMQQEGFHTLAEMRGIAHKYDQCSR